MSGQAEINRRLQAMKRKKKSLVGWTVKEYDFKFTRNGYGDKIVTHSLIYEKKKRYLKQKVRITIEEIK